MTEWSKVASGPEQDAYVRDQFARMWGDGPALAMHIEEFRPAYYVEGRRRNGSFKGKRPIRWFFGRILLPIRNFVYSVFSIALGGGGGPSHGLRTSKVTGPANGMAVGFADATRHEHQHFTVEWCWFIWTRNRSALVRIPNDEFRVETLWQGDGPYRPYVDPANRTLRWRDGSTIVLKLSPWEAERAAQLPPG